MVRHSPLDRLGTSLTINPEQGRQRRPRRRISLQSYAKLNLYLEVLRLRNDNYHNIKTLFERISLADTLILKTRADAKIKIFCKNPAVPKDKTNLCFRAAKLLQDNLAVNKGVDIRIKKIIPVGAGLGGGSSNAASVLLGLNKLWKLNLSVESLARLGSLLGADVPFFIYNTSFALGLGRGDKIKPIKIKRPLRLWHILVAPKLHVSTPVIYKKWDSFSQLTRPKFNVNILILVLKQRRKVPLSQALFNGLEPVTARFYSEVKKIRCALEGLGIKTILMSGSGPAVFGVVSSRKEALSFSRKLKIKEKSWRIYAARTF